MLKDEGIFRNVFQDKNVAKGRCGSRCFFCGVDTQRLSQSRVDGCGLYQPQTCVECGKTAGEALGHKWEEATCAGITAPGTRLIC